MRLKSGFFTVQRTNNQTEAYHSQMLQALRTSRLANGSQTVCYNQTEAYHSQMLLTLRTSRLPPLTNAAEAEVKVLAEAEQNAKLEADVAEGEAKALAEAEEKAELVADATEGNLLNYKSFPVCLLDAVVSFSSCQRNLIKTFQIQGMITLITKMTFIFSSDLLNGQK